jgi:hypothetical protein
MANKGSKAKQKYDAAYLKRPEQAAKNAARKRARRAYEKKHGPLPAGVDVDHKKRLAKGGSNSEDNLVSKPQKENRGWRRGKKGYG